MYHNDNVMDSSDQSKLIFKDFTLLVFGVLCFFIAGIINQRTPKPMPNLLKQETALNINKDLLVFLSAGNKRLLTDLLWVQTLMESDLEHYGARDLNSWMYVRFNTISVLDPFFYQNYLWGGQYLSIIKDDLYGAVALMEKGVKQFPDDYKLNFNLGFAYYFELGDYQKGSVFLDKIKYHPKAPAFIPSLVMKMKVELGFDYNVILSLIYDLMTTTQDSALKEKLTSDFHSLKAERDLTCLNQHKSGCEILDAYGVPYIKVLGKYHTQTPFVPYRLKKKGDSTKAKSITTIE